MTSTKTNLLSEQNPDYTQPVLQSVLVPSDFSAGSLTAFQHALKAALVARSRLTILHLSPGVAESWTEFAGVGETLARWGLLPPGSPKWAVPELGIEVRNVIAREGNPVKSVLRHLATDPADLIVIATHAYPDRVTWLRQTVTEPIARRSAQMTLLLPDAAVGFVSPRDGSVSLGRILIPIAANPPPQPALAAAARLAVRLRRPQGTFVLLHVGGPDTMPAVQCPEVSGWEWKKVTRTGDVIDGIVDAAEKEAADLIVMATDGRNGFLDALRGSHSERVLRKARWPLLTIPVGSLVESAISHEKLVRAN
jgi:nucleotide-binding universal stress UspA family protein